MAPTSSLSVSLFLAVYYASVLPTESFSLQPLNSRNKSNGHYYNLQTSATWQLASSSGTTPFTDDKSNTAYINGLLQNLSALLDKYIMTGNMEAVSTLSVSSC